MGESVTKNNLKKFRNDVKQDIKKAVGDLSKIKQNMMQQISGEFTKVNDRMDKIKASIYRLTITLDGFAKRLEELKKVNAFCDAQFNRLLDWGKKVSIKTGIPLENL